MIFRQLFDPVSSTYSYILGCEGKHEAIVIDSVFEQHNRDTALLRELNLSVRYAIDTHIHADHVTGAWLMKQEFDAQIAIAEKANVTNADVGLHDGETLVFGDCSLTAIATPGHTAGCMTFITEDKSMAFTGDCLLIRSAGRTDFQAGDVETLWNSIRDKIFSLPDGCLIYPAHDYLGRTVSSVAEEKRFNPRIGGDARQEDFSGYMENMNLPHPKLLALAVPANILSGKPEYEPNIPTWGPITVTFAGIPEVEPDWVANNRATLCILDVRNEQEFQGDLGHVEGSMLIPLSELRQRINEVPKEKPVVVICQSGKRSAMATQILQTDGFKQTANIAGGLINWTKLTLPGLIV
jgi:sulfur dioxygenase